VRASPTATTVVDSVRRAAVQDLHLDTRQHKRARYGSSWDLGGTSVSAGMLDPSACK